MSGVHLANNNMHTLLHPVLSDFHREKMPLNRAIPNLNKRINTAYLADGDMLQPNKRLAEGRTASCGHTNCSECLQ